MAQRVVIPGFRKIETSGGGEGAGNYNDLAKAYSNIYVVNSADSTYLHVNDKSVAIDPSSIIWVYDTSYTEATTFKTAMQGQYLYYELANYNTITIDGNEEVSLLLKRIEALESLVNKTDTTIIESE